MAIRIIASASAILILLLWGTPANARIGLSVAPQKFDIVVFPGETYEGKIQIGTTGDLPLPASVRVIEFGAEDGTGTMTLHEPGPDSPSAWFSFETMDFILEPGVRRELPFTISIPDDTPPGGYYTFLMIEPRIPSFYIDEAGPQVVPIVGVPILIATASFALDADAPSDIMEVTQFSIAPEERILFLERFFGGAQSGLGFVNFAFAQSNANAPNIGTQITQRQPNHFLLTIKNNDLFHIQPAGTLSVYNLFGSKIGEAQLRGQTILPGKTRDFPILLEHEEPESAQWLPSSLLHAAWNTVATGRYRAELDLHARSPIRGDVRPEGSIGFAFFTLPIQFWSIFLILLIGTILLRKRLLMALNVLLRR